MPKYSRFLFLVVMVYTSAVFAERTAPRTFDTISRESAKTLISTEDGKEVQSSVAGQVDPLTEEVNQALSLATENASEVNSEGPIQSVSGAISSPTNAVEKKSENEIPVFMDQAKAEKKNDSLLTRMISGFALIGVLLIGAFFALKKYGQKANTSKNKNTQIKVLTQHYLGPKKSIAIIQVAGESLLIGVTDSNISMLKSLALLDEELPAVEPKQFNKSLGSAKGKGQKLKEDYQGVTVANSADFSEGAGYDESDDDTESDEFAMADLKSLVGKKLKKMRVM